MAKEELIEFEGLVTEILPDTRYRVKLDTGHEIIAYTAGKMKKNRIKTLAGDRVIVEMSPYDLEKGRIIFRHKDERASTSPRPSDAPAVPPALSLACGWPPVEECAVADRVELLCESQATFCDRVIEALDGGEAAVGERFVDERPKMFGWLELGTVGGLEHEANAVGHGEVLRPVPAGIVELKHDALGGPGAHRFGKIDEDEFEHLLADGVGDVPHRPSGCRLDETRHIEPLETMMTERDRPLSDRCPHAPHDRLQADAVFIHRPDFNARARMFAPLLVNRGLELFLSVERSSSVAASGWRGRGCWIE